MENRPQFHPYTTMWHEIAPNVHMVNCGWNLNHFSIIACVHCLVQVQHSVFMPIHICIATVNSDLYLPSANECGFILMLHKHSLAHCKWVCSLTCLLLGTVVCFSAVCSLLFGAICIDEQEVGFRALVWFVRYHIISL